eukprot:6230880-Pyramimonas_sp.AAC.1
MRCTELRRSSSRSARCRRSRSNSISAATHRGTNQTQEAWEYSHGVADQSYAGRAVILFSRCNAFSAMLRCQLPNVRRAESTWANLGSTRTL